MLESSRAIPVLALTGLLVITVVLSACAPVFIGEAASVEPALANEPAISTPYTHDVKVLFEEMTLVQLLWEQMGYAKTLCAGNGLTNIQPLPDGPMILIPNAGDLAAGGSNVSIKLSPDGEITFVPRVQGQKIQVPANVGDKVAGEEVLSLSLDEGLQLMAAGELVWTARDRGPYGNGHSLPGHIAACDPAFDESLYLEWEAEES